MKTPTERAAAWLYDASVLLAVAGFLQPLLQPGRFDVWTAAPLTIAVSFYALGYSLDTYFP